MVYLKFFSWVDWVCGFWKITTEKKCPSHHIHICIYWGVHVSHTILIILTLVSCLRLCLPNFCWFLHCIVTIFPCVLYKWVTKHFIFQGVVIKFHSWWEWYPCINILFGIPLLKKYSFFFLYLLKLFIYISIYLCIYCNYCYLFYCSNSLVIRITFRLALVSIWCDPIIFFLNTSFLCDNLEWLQGQ